MHACTMHSICELRTTRNFYPLCPSFPNFPDFEAFNKLQVLSAARDGTLPGKFDTAHGTTLRDPSTLCTQWSCSGFKSFGIVSRKGHDLPHLDSPGAPAAAVDDVSDDLPLVLAAAYLVPEHLLRQRPLDRLLQLQELGVVPQVGQRVARP